MIQNSQEAQKDPEDSDSGSYGSLNELYDHNNESVASSDNELSDVDDEDVCDSQTKNQEEQQPLDKMNSDNEKFRKRAEADLPQSQPEPQPIVFQLFNLRGPKQTAAASERKVVLPASQDNNSPSEKNPFVNLFGWMNKDESPKKEEAIIAEKNDAKSDGERNDSKEGVKDDGIDTTSPLSSSSQNNIELELGYSPGGGLQADYDLETIEKMIETENDNDRTSSIDEIQKPKRHTSSETESSYVDLISEGLIVDIDQDYVALTNEKLIPSKIPRTEVESDGHLRENHSQNDVKTKVSTDILIEKRDLSENKNATIAIDKKEAGSELRASFSTNNFNANFDGTNKNNGRKSPVLTQDSKKLNNKDVKEKVLQMLKLHDPSKMKKIDKMMDRFKGREAELLEKMEKRYSTHDHEEMPYDERGNSRKKPSPNLPQSLAFGAIAAQSIPIEHSQKLKHHHDGEGPKKVSVVIS